MNSPARIMVVDDDAATREFLVDNLSADSYDALGASTAREAFSLLERNGCDLMLLDVVLPDLSGLEVCRQLRGTDGLAQRADPELPVIMLSARASETDRVRGLVRGADDYVTKPFHYPELAARIAAVLSRSRGRRAHRVLQVRELKIDPLAHEATLAGRRLELSAKEFALLRLLASEPTRVFTKEELLRDVWHYRSMGSTRTLDSHASRLRRKLASSTGRWIVNVWGVGYRLMDDAP